MTTLAIRLPDWLGLKMAVLAGEENVSVDAVVTMALASQLVGREAHNSVAARARRGNPDDLRKALDRVRSWRGIGYGLAVQNESWCSITPSHRSTLPVEAPQIVASYVPEN